VTGVQTCALPILKILESYAFRITRNADLELEEEEEHIFIFKPKLA